MNGRSRVRVGVVVLVSVVTVGTLVYWLFEGFSLLDALYQTVITVTTVGFGEVQPLDTSGRAFTIVLILGGVSALFYAVGGLVEEVVESQLFRFGRLRMNQRIQRLKGHIIVCGFGRVGRESAHHLGSPDNIVVVERQTPRVERAAEAGFAVVEGDATDDDVLRDAGIERASALVLCLQTDADAMSATLSARQLNPTIRIVCRATQGGSEAKLRRAGADYVVNPLMIGAHRLVQFTLAPAVADFVDVAMQGGSLEFRLEETVVPQNSPVDGMTIRDAHIRSRTGALVLALLDADGNYDVNPRADTQLHAGQTVIVVGTPDQIEAINTFMGAGAR